MSPKLSFFQKLNNVASSPKSSFLKPISFNPENENKVETMRIGAKRPRTTMDSILEKLNK